MAIADRSLEGVVEVERGAGRDVEQIQEAERIEIRSLAVRPDDMQPARTQLLDGPSDRNREVIEVERDPERLDVGDRPPEIRLAIIGSEAMCRGTAG